MAKKNRIALVNPPAPFLADQRVFPNLGILQLATSWRDTFGADVDLVDLNGLAPQPISDSLDSIANDYHFVGFSSTTPQFKETHKLNASLKSRNPRVKTILGGAHPSAIYSLIRSGRRDDINISALDQFDFLVAGEGETLDPTSMQRGWNIARNEENLDTAPFPDRGMMDIKSYVYHLKGKPTTTIMTQRGCPFGCNFCSGRDIDMYRKTRSKSPGRILEELDYLNGEFGFDSFMWFDDELNVNPKRLLEVSRLLSQRDYQHRGFVRSDLVLKHPETLQALAEAGFVELCSGVESGSKRILDVLGKQTTPEINSAAARMIMDAGFSYKAFTLIGSPSETREDVEATFQWLRDIKPTGFDVTILTPYPGSKLYDHSQPSTKFPGFDREWKGLYFRNIDYSKDESFYKGRQGEYQCHVRTDSLSPEDILSLRDSIETELRPAAKK